MDVLVANPPAYLWDENRRYIQGGSRWSHSTPISRDKVKMNARKGIYSYTPYPFFLGYAASYVADASNVSFYDGVVLNHNESDFLQFVSNRHFDLIVMETPTVSFDLDMRLLQEAKQLTDASIAITGFHASALFEQEMQRYPFIDFAFVNEYEETLKELISKNLDPNGIRGLAYRRGDAIRFNGPRSVIKDISRMPFPFRDPETIRYYTDFTLAGHPNIQMMSSRGCPVGCHFCYTTIFYENSIYRPRSPSNVVEEMKFVKEVYGARQVYFDDDTISINSKHIENLCREMIKEKIDIPWTCMGDITVKRENVELMKKAGCIGMKFGVETVNPEVLRKMHKGIIAENKVVNFRNLLRREGLWAHATFSIGHPGDTEETIRNSMKFAKMLKPDSLQVSIATPIPGTQYYQETVDNNWLSSKDWNKFDGCSGSIVNYEGLNQATIDKLYLEFNEME